MPVPWSPSAESLAAAVWELDLTTGELAWSEGMHRIAGSDPRTTRPSMTWWTSLVVPADRARVRAWLLVVRETGRGGEERFTLVGADGVERSVHAWAEVESGPDGVPVTMFGSAVDVTATAAPAARDPLTSTTTRPGVLERLARALRTAPERTAVLLLDLDRFAVLDDALGRTAGDALLRSVADRLRDAAPEGATVGRLDGDTFAVVVEDVIDETALASLADRVLAAARRPHLLPGQREALTTTASLGAATGADGPSSDAEDVLRHAGLALRRAKRDGRDRWVRYREALGEAALARVRTEAVLRSALDAGRLQVLYQPVVELASGEVVGVEALARIVDPDLGPLSPALFVDVAEETGLVVRLDEWVLGRASAMARRWRPPTSGAPRVVDLPETGPAAGPTPCPDGALPTVAVNMSSRTLSRPDLPRLVSSALRLSGSDPSRLLVEITEHSLLDQGEDARGTLDGLTGLGVAVGIDDFGTGWSALSYLSSLDLAFMKVDRCFVARLGVDASAAAVVQAVVDLAHAHDLTVIAEGVETEEQARMLVAMGCDHGQGWWFGRPQAEADLDGAVRAWHDRARTARFGAWSGAAAAAPAPAAPAPAPAAAQVTAAEPVPASRAARTAARAASRSALSLLG